MEYDRVRLKQSARQAMKFQRPRPMLVTLLFIIVVNIGSRVVGGILGAASGSSGMATMYAKALLEYDDPAYAIQYVLLSFGPERLALALFVGLFISGIITYLWTGLMRTGYCGFCLDMVRGRQPQTDALFSAFSQWADVLLTQFLTGLFQLLWGLLFGAAAGMLLVIFLLLFNELPGLFFASLVVVYLAAMVAVIWVTLRYAMVNFLIVDQGLTGMDAVRESKRMMQGNTGRLFALNLSFIGWYLLGIGAFIVLCVSSAAIVSGLGPVYSPMDAAGRLLGILGMCLVAIIAVALINLWLTPYITGAQALFYDQLRGVDSTPAGGYGFGPSGGWGQPQDPQHFDYTWTPGPTSGTGIGSGPKDGGDGAPPQSPKPPKSPKDDPWD